MENIELVDGIKFNGEMVDFVEELAEHKRFTDQIAYFNAQIDEQNARVRAMYAKYPDKIPAEIIEAFELTQP